MCPHCGFKLSPTAIYCERCGTRVQATADSAAEERAERWGWDVRGARKVSAPQPSKPFLDKTGKRIVIFALPVMALVIGLAFYLDRQERAKRAAYLASIPTPTPFVPLPPADALKMGKAVIEQEGLPSGDELTEAVQNLRTIDAGKKEFKQAQELLRKADALTEKRKQHDAIRGPLPEMIGEKVWCVDRYLKYNLNDYDNAEYLHWSAPVSIIYDGQPYWAVKLRLRAANAFGGKIIKEPVFLIQQDQVVRVEGL